MSRFIATALTLALLLGAVLGFSARFLIDTYYGPGPLGNETTVIIENNNHARDIARVLKNSGVIDNETYFLGAALLTGKFAKLQAGEYSFPAGCSLRRALTKISEGQVVQHAFVMPEGWTVRQVLAALNQAQKLKGYIQHIPAEGMLLPDTYYYRYGDTRADILRRMQRAMDETLQNLWAKRDPNTPFQSPQDALILASVVEKESRLPAERARIAGVFINRLAINMPLQADPTIIYGLTNGAGQLGRSLTHDDLTISNPYNSYLNKGLPPTPIANPGRATITAVLHPENNKFLYFVADGTGGHAFAETLDAHNRNISSWIKSRRSGR